jgi:TnpA family transposase
MNSYMEARSPPAERREGHHSLARVVFRREQGDPRERHRKGQEAQLGALGLVAYLLSPMV